MVIIYIKSSLLIFLPGETTELKAPLHSFHHCSEARESDDLLLKKLSLFRFNFITHPHAQASAYTAYSTRAFPSHVLYCTYTDTLSNPTYNQYYYHGSLSTSFYYSTVQPECRLAPLTRCRQPFKGMIPWYQPEGCEPSLPFNRQGLLQLSVAPSAAPQGTRTHHTSKLLYHTSRF
jgi:hypothetical protein